MIEDKVLRDYLNGNIFTEIFPNSNNVIGHNVSLGNQNDIIFAVFR